MPGPSGQDWGPSTIHGNPDRGTGILNNELYIGKLVWNRLRYIKDPETGKRVSRPNPESEWITQDVADLRIIADDLWQAVKARQKSLAQHAHRQEVLGLLGPPPPALPVLRPDALRLLRRRVRRPQCRAYRLRERPQQRHLRQQATIRRDALEATVLEGLQSRLMDPARAMNSARNTRATRTACTARTTRSTRLTGPR